MQMTNALFCATRTSLPDAFYYSKLCSRAPSTGAAIGAGRPQGFVENSRGWGGGRFSLLYSVYVYQTFRENRIQTHRQYGPRIIIMIIKKFKHVGNNTQITEIIAIQLYRFLILCEILTTSTANMLWNQPVVVVVVLIVLNENRLTGARGRGG